MKNRQRGLTLWELAFVVIIVSILLAIALPSYQRYVLKSHRSEARAILVDILTAQENFRVYCGGYASKLDAAEVCEAGSIRLGRAASAEYFSTAMTLSDNSFTATASAVGHQQDDTQCRIMTVQVSGPQVAFNPPECWK